MSDGLEDVQSSCDPRHDRRAGLLLAVPLTTVVKVVCDHVEELQPVGRLLGE